MEHQNWPIWAEPANPANANLPNLLSLASSNFDRHINWYFRHCENGIRNLAAIIAAEAAIVGLYFSHLGPPAGVVCALFVGLLGLVAAPFLCDLAIKSSTRSFTAAMESTRLMTKCVWAMGLTGKVAVGDKVPGIIGSNTDPFLYPERWTTGPLEGSEKEFVENCMKRPGNSHKLTKKTLVVICAVATVQGIGSVAAIVWNGL